MDWTLSLGKSPHESSQFWDYKHTPPRPASHISSCGKNMWYCCEVFSLAFVLKHACLEFLIHDFSSLPLVPHSVLTSVLFSGVHHLGFHRGLFLGRDSVAPFLDPESLHMENLQVGVVSFSSLSTSQASVCSLTLWWNFNFIYGLNIVLPT